MFQNWDKLNRIIYILGSIFILASNLLGGKLDLLQLGTLIGTLLGFLSVAFKRCTDSESKKASRHCWLTVGALLYSCFICCQKSK